MQNYLDKIKPKVGDAWRTDELYLKIRGNTKYLYAIMDDQTRYLIAQQVADTKYSADITPMFRKAKLVTGKKPNEKVTELPISASHSIKNSIQITNHELDIYDI